MQFPNPMSSEARVSAFIKSELQWYIEQTTARSREQLTRRNIRVDDTLLNSLVGSMESSIAASLAFSTHGRFHDMGAGRGWHKGRYTGRDERRDGERKPHKPSNWYSRTKWGLIGQLTSNLSNKYLETIAYEAQQMTKTNT